MSAEPRFRAPRRVAAGVVVLVLATLLAAPSAGADTKSELAAATAKLDALIGQIASEQAAVDSLQAQVNDLVAKIDQVQSQIATTQAAIAKLQAEIEAANRQLAKLQTQLDQRAWVAYENGPGSTVEMLLGSTSLADFSDRLEIVNRAAASDQDLIDRMRDERAALSAKRVQQQKLQTSLKATQADLVVQQNAITAKLNSAQQILTQLAADKAEAAKLVGQLKEKRQQEIEAARLAAIEAARKKAAEEAAAKAAAGGGSSGGGTTGSGGGAVSGHPFQVCPVDPPKGYGDDFGAPRYGGGYHQHAGNDIFAPLGTPIRAPFSGTASDASNGLGGISVYVYGPEGYVYNAHLSSIGTLGSVSAGTIIGYVGNTGDAQGGATHDHFEWHPNSIPANAWTSPYGASQIGDAIDPYPYLNQVC